MRADVIENVTTANKMLLKIPLEFKSFHEPYPSLLEIGIMGNCDIGQSGVCLSSGIQCSQNGLVVREANMSLPNYKRIIDESRGRTEQVILSGRGDPDRHPDFIDMLKYTNKNMIVANYVTSGFHLNTEIIRASKNYCGFTGISFHNQYYTYRAINMLLSEGVDTNLFFVISKASIDDAIKRLENNGFPEGLNAVVFLLHKPVGQGSRYNMLDLDDDRVGRFFRLLSWKGNSKKVHIDFCSTPGLINTVQNIRGKFLKPCDAGIESAYISSDMNMMPCSYCIDMENWKQSIIRDTIENAWNSKLFSRCRSLLANRCPHCSRQKVCGGGCPVMPEIVLCNRDERDYALN